MEIARGGRLLWPAVMILIAFLAGALPAGAQTPRRAPDRILTGTLTGADHQSYKRIAFELPEGVAQLFVSFDYDTREQKTVIDLGVEDPHGLRGASGGNKPGFLISASEATPSYLPGRLDAGTWRLALAVPNIRQGTTARWRAQLWFLRASETQPISASVPNRGPGWYRGDLHLHSAHSDGSCASQLGARVPCPLFLTLQAAAARKLDFVAVTEHNTTSHHSSLREAQTYFDRMLLIPGREITTFYGHFNVFGVVEPLDFRIQPPGRPSFNELADRVHALGGIVSINHPALPSGEACMGCGWRMPDADLAKADAVEVVNGGSLAAAGDKADGTLSGLPFWLAALERGRTITAIGGSDNHDAHRAPSDLGAVGRPTTVVRAESFDQRAILDGIKAGRVFIDVAGTADRLLDFQLESGGRAAPMGSDLKSNRGAPIVAELLVEGVPDGTLELLSGGRMIHSRPIGGERVWRIPVRLARGRHHVRAQVRGSDGSLLLIGNSVLVAIP